MIGDPQIEVWCDGCGAQEYFGLTPLAQSGSWDDRHLKRAIERKGWVIDGDKTYCCEECKP